MKYNRLFKSWLLSLIPHDEKLRPRAWAMKGKIKGINSITVCKTAGKYRWWNIEKCQYDGTDRSFDKNLMELLCQIAYGEDYISHYGK